MNGIEPVMPIIRSDVEERVDDDLSAGQHLTVSSLTRER